MDKVRRFHSVGVRWLLLLGAVFFFWASISAQVRPHRSGGERKLQESAEVVQLVYADNVIRREVIAGLALSASAQSKHH